jgi:hypothetical protein
MGARVDRLRGIAGGAGCQVCGIAAAWCVEIHRASLSATLHDAIVAQRILVETGRTIAGSQINENKRYFLFQNGTRSEPFDIAVDALAPPATPTGRQRRKYSNFNGLKNLWCALGESNPSCRNENPES